MGEKLPPGFPMKLVMRQNLINQVPPLMSLCAPKSLRPEYVFAQAPTKIARIGWLTAQREASLTPYIKAMREALTELGYVEGKNLRIDFRYGDDAIERVPELTADLERIPVDLIVAQGAAVEIINKLKLKMPVVYVFSGDPVSAHLAESLAKPPHGM